MPAGGKTRLASPMEWETERGYPKLPEWRNTPGGVSLGSGRGVKLPRGADTTRVEELPQGDKTSGVTVKGNGITGADGRRRGG